MTSPYGGRTASRANGARTRAGGWFSALVAGARIAGLALLTLGLVSLVPGVSPAYAGEDGLTWDVTQASGNVLYRMGGKAPTGWRALQVGAVLGAAAEVRTGSDSRALLTHQGTTLSVSPESGLKLPGRERSEGVYRVFQSLGTLLYRIKERAAGMAAFEVETPYLAVVVKGTVFTVNAARNGTTVYLTEGVVDLQPTLGGTGATLTPGHTARITAVPGVDVIIKDQDAGKRSRVTPPRGKGNGGAATSSGANASQGAKAHRGKGVTISRSAKSNSGYRVRHPRAVVIFASNNRGGLFAKDVKVKNAFEKSDGALGSSKHGAQVSTVAKALVTYGGADVSAKAKDGGLALGADKGRWLALAAGNGDGLSNSGSGNNNAGGLSNSGSGGGVSSSGLGASNGGGLSNSGSGGGVSSSGLGASNGGGVSSSGLGSGASSSGLGGGASSSGLGSGASSSGLGGGASSSGLGGGTVGGGLASSGPGGGTLGGGMSSSGLGNSALAGGPDGGLGNIGNTKKNRRKKK